MSIFLKNIFKFLITFSIVLFLFIPSVFATDIDMNLTQDTNTIDSNTIGSIENAISDVINTNETGNTTVTNPNGGIAGTAAPSGVSSIAQENMSFANILNILVITVGVVLILLAIAILIRLKS